jgi:sporulation protein YlmC with PRC-barrel domain
MLHKISKLQGYHIVAADGEIGHVDDFLIDENGRTRHLVVDTSNWIGGKSVLISPESIEKIDSPEKEIRVRLTRAEVEQCPSLDSADIELIETLPPPVI